MRRRRLTPLRFGRRRIAVIPLLTVIGLAALLAWQLDGRAASAPVESSQEAASACAAGSAIASPTEQPELVADCDALLAAKDQLRGTAALNWSADLALASWTGVTVSGTPRRITALRLANRQLDGTIPPELGTLSQLQLLDLGRNRLTGAIPAELGDLADLTRLQLQSYRQGARVLLRATPSFDRRIDAWSGACSGDAETCVVTMDADKSVGVSFEPLTYSLTVSANAGGTVAPAGTTSYTEPTKVALTASWNDATHSFSGWSGDCVGTTSTCELLVDDDLSVTATFAELPADRCATPPASDCIRAVYLGAPDDYDQVADIPDDRLIARGDDGRYTINRGQQITVVTAAPLPTGHSRFVPNIRPDAGPSPTSQLQLIPPVGTTSSLTASADAYAADRFALDLHAARTRPGNNKPIPGAVVVTARFNVRPDPLALELTSSRVLCTAGTLTELSWTIAGGKPPYTLTIDGQTVDAEAESHRVNCEAIPTDPVTGDPADNPTKTFTATVRDSQTAPMSTSASVSVDLAAALPAPPNLQLSGLDVTVKFGFDYTVAGAGAQAPEDPEPFEGLWKPGYLIRVRAAGADPEDPYHVVRLPLRRDAFEWSARGAHHGMVASMRHPIERHTPDALIWSQSDAFALAEPAQNITVTTTHDTATVSWDEQPLADCVTLEVRGHEYYNYAYTEDFTTTSGRQTHTFERMPPETDFVFEVWIGCEAPIHAGIGTIASNSARARTKSAPPGWTPPLVGPQNVRATATHNEITVAWDPPHPDARPAWRAVVYVGDRYFGTLAPSGGTELRIRFGMREFVQPSTTYRIVVTHFGPTAKSGTLTVTTAAAPTSGARSQTPTGSHSPFSPRWSVSVERSFYATDDPFDWRPLCE